MKSTQPQRQKESAEIDHFGLDSEVVTNPLDTRTLRSLHLHQRLVTHCLESCGSIQGQLDQVGAVPGHHNRPENLESDGLRHLVSVSLSEIGYSVVFVGRQEQSAKRTHHRSTITEKSLHGFIGEIRFTRLVVENAKVIAKLELDQRLLLGQFCFRIPGLRSLQEIF